MHEFTNIEMNQLQKTILDLKDFIVKNSGFREGKFIYIGNSRKVDMFLNYIQDEEELKHLSYQEWQIMKPLIENLQNLHSIRREQVEAIDHMISIIDSKIIKNNRTNLNIDAL